MVKQVRGDSGKIYSYADDVPDELIVQDIKAQEKPAEWGDVLGQAWPEVQRGAALGIAGVTEGIEDAFGVDTAGKEVREFIRAEREQQLPKNMSLTQQGVLSGLASVPEMGVGMAAGVGAGLATGNPAVGLAVGVGLPAISETAREYGEQRGGGMAPGRAAVHAAISGAGEAVGELAPMGVLVNKLGKVGFGKFLSEWFGKEFAGEQLTTAWQDVNRKLSIQPDLTVGDWLKDAYITGVATAVGGTTVSPLVGAVHVVPTLQREQRMRAFAKALQEEVEGVDMPESAAVSGKQESWNTNIKKLFADMGVQQGLFESPVRPDLTETDVPVLAEDLLPADVTTALQDYFATNPTEQGIAKFVMANLPVLAKAYVDVPALVTDAVNAGTVTPEVGQRAIATVERKLANVVEKLTLEETAAREKYEAEVAGYNLPAQDLTGTAFQAEADAVLAIDPETPGLFDGSDFQVEDKLEALGVPAHLVKAVAAPVEYGVLASPGAGRSALRKSKFRSLQRMYRAFPTWNLAEPHPFQPRVRDISFAISPRIAGQKVTFGPDRGKAIVADRFAPGHVNSYNESTSTDFRTEKRMVAILRRWGKKYLPNVDIVLHIRDHSPEEEKGGHMRAVLGADGKVRTVEILVVPEVYKTDARIVNVLAHEFGHALFIVYYRQAAPKMQAALVQQWREHLLKSWDKPLNQYLKETGGIDSRTWVSDGRVGEWITYAWTSAEDASEKEIYYWPNFWEWHAHNMERVLANDVEGFAQPVRTFWKRAFEQLKKFFIAEHPLWQPGQSMAEWLRIGRMQELEWNGAIHRLQDTVQQAQLTGLGGFVSAMGQAPAAEMGTISPQNYPQSEPSSTEPPGSITQDFVSSVQGLRRVLRRVDPTHGGAVTNAVVKFNEQWARFLGSFQVLKMNLNVPGAQQFLQALRDKMGYKNVWLREANAIAAEWESLGKEQSGAVAKLLLTEANEGVWYSEQMDDPQRPGRSIFVLDADKAQAFGINDRGAELYSKVRSIFAAALDAYEQLGVQRIYREFLNDPDNPQMQAQLQELQAAYQRMREKPYTPFSRFGQFYVRIKAKEAGMYRDPFTKVPRFVHAGETVYFETFESEIDRAAALGEIRGKYESTPMFTPEVSLGKIHDIVYSMRNLPPAFLESVITRLDLTPEQITEYRDIVKDLAADSSFIKHMKRKANIAGYSPDALRGFADYMQRFANNIAKHQSTPAFDNALKLVREHKRNVEQDAYNKGLVPDTTRLDQFYDWMVRTRDYVMNPGNEWGELKSFVAAWYLGFNIPSAAQNITQVPFFTLPYLSKRFGTVKALGALKSATRDILAGWKNPTRLTDDERAMLTHALEQGFIDESFATSVAQYAEGTALTRLSSTALRHRLLNHYNFYAMWMFQKAEEINRRISLLATYRLNRRQEYAGAFDEQAALEARNAVEITQNEYAIENRPEFMRGNKSIIFQFMHYMQNAIFQMLGGDISWKRMLLMQLAVAGMLGLPFADDLMDFFKWLAKKFGMPVEPELYIRELLTELNVQPDIVLRGMSSQAGWFDLSHRYSLGRVIPGVEPLASNLPFPEAITMAVGDVGGAGASVVLGVMKAMSNLHSPDALRTVSYAAPSFVKYPLNALRAAEQGGVYTRDMTVIAPLESGEYIGMGIGLQPRAASKAWKSVGFQREIEAYWTTRRGALLENYYWAMRSGDREAMADLRASLREYNREAVKVDPALVVDRKVLKRSLSQRMRAAEKHQVYGTPNAYRNIAKDVQEAVNGE